MMDGHAEQQLGLDAELEIFPWLVRARVQLGLDSELEVKVLHLTPLNDTVKPRLWLRAPRLWLRQGGWELGRLWLRAPRLWLRQPLMADRRREALCGRSRDSTATTQASQAQGLLGSL